MVKFLRTSYHFVISYNELSNKYSYFLTQEDPSDKEYALNRILPLAAGGIITFFVTSLVLTSWLVFGACAIWGTLLFGYATYRDSRPFVSYQLTNPSPELLSLKREPMGPRKGFKRYWTTRDRATEALVRKAFFAERERREDLRRGKDADRELAFMEGVRKDLTKRAA